MTGVVPVVVVILGCLVVGATLLDLMVTALHPGVESPFSARFHHGIWALVRTFANALPATWRRHVLEWTLPLSIAGLVSTWLIALLVGYALVYLPAMHSSRAFVVTHPLGWSDALYFSGMCLTTMGIGDIVPRGGVLRAVTVTEGMCGLLIVGVAITYVLAVFPVLPISSVLATTLNEESDGRVDAIPLVRRYLAVGAAEVLAQRCRETADVIMRLSEAHTTHPVLFYAHPRQAERSFLRAIIVTQRMVAILRYGLQRDDYPTLVRDPRVVGLEESLIQVLRTMGASLHLTVEAPDVAEGAAGLRREYTTLVRTLHEEGLRGDATPHPRERETFVRYRLATDPYINAYGVNSGYSVDELWGTHPPLRGTTAPIPLVEDDEDPRGVG